MVVVQPDDDLEQPRRRWWDNCDCGGCDLPTFHLPSCDLPGCEMPSCDVPCCDVPGCDIGLLSAAMLLVSRISRTKKGSDRAVIAAIKAYRRVSPRLPTRCRFVPTCSAYGLEAVRRHGSRKGLWLTAGRLRRCRPGVPYGTPDPVP